MNIGLLFVIVFGITFGSFINAYVWRVHKQYESSGSKKAVSPKSKSKYSILRGRSICPNCEHVLAPIDLIPIFSWLMQSGKCRYCNKPISRIYPLVEASTLFLFIVSFFAWPLSMTGAGLVNFIFWLIYLVFLIALAVYDIKWFMLPNRMVYPLYALAIVQIVVMIIFFGAGIPYILGHLYGFFVGGGVFYILFQVSSGKWIGGGDVKLGAALGLILGSGLYGGVMIFLSSLLGTLLALPLMATGKLKKNSLIPYGPLLIAATIIIVLFGASIKSWFNARGLVI
ncbi:MAG TPA: prepilin peptidase [Candidatus Saccharimonadales bacterium]